LDALFFIAGVKTERREYGSGPKGQLTGALTLKTKTTMPRPSIMPTIEQEKARLFEPVALALLANSMIRVQSIADISNPALLANFVEHADIIAEGMAEQTIKLREEALK